MTSFLDKKKLIYDTNKKVKNKALDFTVPTGGIDVCFLALQPGIATGG